MEMRHFGLVFLALFLSSATVLINRFVTKVPTWLASVFAVVAVGALILYAVLNWLDKKNGVKKQPETGKKKKKSKSAG